MANTIQTSEKFLNSEKKRAHHIKKQFALQFTHRKKSETKIKIEYMKETT